MYSIDQNILQEGFWYISLDKSISVGRANDFLDRNCIEHQCIEVLKIEFILENWYCDLYIDDNYFKMNLGFPLADGTGRD